MGRGVADGVSAPLGSSHPFEKLAPGCLEDPFIWPSLLLDVGPTQGIEDRSVGGRDLQPS